MRVSEEVFRLFCTRVARAEHPTDTDGREDIPSCEGTSPLRAPTPQMQSLLERRATLVTALDQVFGDAPPDEVTAQSFAHDELSDFMAQLLPFYDDGTLPESTRALERVAQRLLDDSDPTARDTVDALARLSGRVGYRHPRDTLAAARPMLSYPHFDALSQNLLPVLGEDGDAHEPILRLLQAGALELAEPREETSSPDDTTLHVAKELLFRTSPEFAAADEPTAWIVERDLAGNALAADDAGPNLAPPFPAPGRDDDTPRDAEGRALSAPDGAPLYRYRALNDSLLAALMREQKQLVERKDPATPSTVEKAARGVRVLLGPDVPREAEFVDGAGKPRGKYAFSGPNVEQSPLLDLVHAGSVILQYPETERVLRLLLELLTNHESEANAPLYAALAVDARSDLHPEAFLVGVDGEPHGPNEFWDDMLALLIRMLERPGMLKALLDFNATPDAPAYYRILARFMKFKDDVGYNGAPLAPGPDGRYSAADAKTLNSPIVHTFADLVMRDRQGLDVGMNRSIFQRLTSLNQGTYDISTCNKEAATVNIPTGLGFDLTSGPFARCALSRIPNSAVLFARAQLGRAKLVNKDPGTAALGDDLVSQIQADGAQLDGFFVMPEPRSLSRLLYAPPNKFVSNFLEPVPTHHGVLAAAYEPNLMFILEVEHADIRVGGKPMSYLSAATSNLRGYDDHEIFADSPDGEIAPKGYLNLELTSTFHNHYDSRRDTRCPIDDSHPVCRELGLTGTDCAAGCTQSLDPRAPYFSHQTNLVSYEPLVQAAIEDDALFDTLQQQGQVIGQLQVDGRDGNAVLSELFERLLRPDPNLRYRDGRRFAVTSTCVAKQAASLDQPPTCDCPHGSAPSDEDLCRYTNGTLVPRGRVIAGGIPPLYLLLDALNRIDAEMDRPENEERKRAWREARSDLVDQYLTVERSGPAESYRYALANRRARGVTLTLIEWLLQRIEHYRALGGQAQIESWALGLPDRLAKKLAHPLLPPLLDMLDVIWQPEHADAARELARYNAYLLDSANSETFVGLLAAAGDTLELVERDQQLGAVAQFASLALADDAFTAQRVQRDAEPDVEHGMVMRSLRVSEKTANLRRPDAASTPMSRLLANAVLPNEALAGRAPLEIVFDAIADVNRSDPSVATSVQHTPEDVRAVLTQLSSFLSDPDRGLERIYNVIRERKLP